MSDDSERDTRLGEWSDRPSHRSATRSPAAPILVTGVHRSGTTWIGRMLALAGDVSYMSEPLNPYSPGPLLSLKTSHQYRYICEKNEACFLNAYKSLTKLEYPFRREWRAVRRPADVARITKRAARLALDRRRGARPLFKDPFAFFSIPWFLDRLGCVAVVTVRHPAAVVSSLKRLGWRFNFAHLLDQPLLIEDLLAPYEAEMERLRRSPADIVLHGSLLWKMVYDTASRFSEGDDRVVVVRHEDLSSNPVERFGGLYRALGLRSDAGTADSIRAFTDERNPVELESEQPKSVRLNSRASLENWRHRLTTEEILRIRELTEGVVERYYPVFDEQPARVGSRESS